MLLKCHLRDDGGHKGTTSPETGVAALAAVAPMLVRSRLPAVMERGEPRVVGDMELRGLEEEVVEMVGWMEWLAPA